ncbi:hypothetical protein [Amycolatopsis methanolica]|uniref:Uncharacterized protein n=1 Tax=Amycolatopsis methanolica 239 TaxID=1068978 RepID=A0A076MTE5_AMYME|nr:hypothetical protein [Amycolatopsis methanolica]AIJ23984.1 hypothetical protein AMETH_3892 [Amycolatopsis methanolica 239]
MTEEWVAGTARPSGALVHAAQGLDEAGHVAEAGLGLVSRDGCCGRRTSGFADC